MGIGGCAREEMKIDLHLSPMLAHSFLKWIVEYFSARFAFLVLFHLIEISNDH